METTVLFVIIGAGLGHLTRGLAIATQFMKLNKNCKIIFFTTNGNANIIDQFHYEYYYLPNRGLLSQTMKAPEYNAYMKEILTGIMEKHQPEYFIFDGAFPYPCIVNRMRERISMHNIWIKREGDRQGFNDAAIIAYKKYFDCIIIPEELGQQEYREYLTKEKLVPPMILIDDDMDLRDRIRNRFPITSKRKVWYVQLGREHRDKQSSLLNQIINTILNKDNAYIVLGESIDGPRIEMKHTRIWNYRNYPNSAMFSEIDFAITTAGYNIVHELAYYNIPAILVPDLSVVKDDQRARALRLEGIGGAVTLEDYNQLDSAIEHLMMNELDMKKKLEETHFVNGAQEAAEIILSMGENNKLSS